VTNQRSPPGEHGDNCSNDEQRRSQNDQRQRRYPRLNGVDHAERLYGRRGFQRQDLFNCGGHVDTFGSGSTG
jgi:hypothetical protein